jgi:FlaA1/EpsC-like NDP-sugar epimerase
MELAKRSNQVRDVSPEDLLGRPQASFDQDVIRQSIQGKVVLVTGAAGSIGSELCRQIVGLSPSALVGFDRADKALLELARDLDLTFPGVVFHAEIGDISRRDDVNRVMRQRRPSIVYHAAASKHVPLMEQHPFAAVENNVFGTWQLATSAANYGVEFFVLISTDKAVHPASIMGATKRVAELLIRALQQDHGTKFVAVRFGNVLGSSGSVIPIFKEQIAAGGPVTVTHPDMQRYFMTPSEAGQLVLQATTIGKSGEVFVLEMGTPVRILDLARNLIWLSGLLLERDIRIEFTGVRPGEKLFEELKLKTEQISPTTHPMIHNLISQEEVDGAAMRRFLEELQQAALAQDIVCLLKLMKRMVPDYTPSPQLLQGASRFANTCADQVPGWESDEASLICPSTIGTA